MPKVQLTTKFTKSTKRKNAFTPLRQNTCWYDEEIDLKSFFVFSVFFVVELFFEEPLAVPADLTFARAGGKFPHSADLNDQLAGAL